MESLCNFQSDLYSRICKAKANYKKSPKERLTKEYLDGRLESVDQLWFEFLSGHKDLLRNHSPKELNASDYIKSELYDKCEEVYMEYKCDLKTLLSKFNQQSKKDDLSTSNINLTSSPHVKLPKISIPNFSGQYSEWCTFRELFQALIGQNDTLNNVQRLHYLKSYLTGEAEQLLRHIPIQEANFKRCWQLLEERFNNKKYISHQVLKRLLSQKNLTVESASGLKDLVDTTNDCLATLSNLGIDVTSWDILIIHILTLKLDSETRRQWEFSVTTNTSSDELPTYNQFQEFLTQRFRAIEFLDTKSMTGYKSQTNKVKSLHVTNETTISCPFCNEGHRLSQCKGFHKESIEARRKFVFDSKACFNCLGSNHSAKECRTSLRCRICKRNHHSLLHPKGSDPSINANSAEVNNGGRGATSSDSATASSSHSNEGQKTSDMVSCFAAGKGQQQVLLATAIVMAMAKNGKRYSVRALLDQGSQGSFITESTVQYLGLKKSPTTNQVTGLGSDKSVVSKSVVTIDIQSRVDSNVKIPVKAYVLNSITSLLPSKRVEIIEWKDISVALADPQYYVPNKIDILLGAEVYAQILQNGVKRGPLGTPTAQATSLGWILSGIVNSTADTSSNITVMHCCANDGNEILKRFWELESDIQQPREVMFTEDENRCEEHYAEMTRRDDDGRYVVRLPFKNGNPEVRGCREIAEKRLRSLEQRLNKNQTLKLTYRDVINEYLALGHMEKVPENEVDNPKAIYLPHHAVIRQDKDTTKVRVVFDASCKGRNNRSLNDQLLVGPTLQPDLRHIITQWREAPICIAADVVKMYRQVKIDMQDADYQRILWTDETTTKLTSYRLTRVTFGTAAAPYLAVKSLQQVAHDHVAEFPTAAEKTLKHFYVDDLMTGVQNHDEGRNLYKEMNMLLAKGGFSLQKWTSNSEELLQEMKNYEQEKEKVQTSGIETEEGLKIKGDEVMKIVGLIWNRSEDSFRYQVDIVEVQEPATKRTIISDISRFYDPLGWVGPSIIIAKMIIQKLWLAGLDWDECVPTSILTEWKTYKAELKLLCNVSIPRWIGLRSGDFIELHGFSDASKNAYAGVVYSRVIDSQGKIHISLICAKTKVAPVKQVSIPRLELCGAVLLTRLMMDIALILNIEKSHLHAWTDSMVVLAWLNSHPSRWKVFVANRVSEIITNLDSHHWSHVPTKCNPADAASRGQGPFELLTNALWFNGPSFLHNESIDYKKRKEVYVKVEEENVITHCVTSNNDESLMDRFSSLVRMVRVLAYCKRFSHNLKTKKPERHVGFLTTMEMQNALECCIQRCQSVNFSKEIAILKNGYELPKRNSLRALNPFLKNNLLRVGGRLEHSQLKEDRKHPILIPKQSHLTTLIIADAHKQTLHGGPQLMLAYILSKYWIVGAKQLVKACYRKCVTCVKVAATSKNPLMGQLPSARVTPSRSFNCSGVDYAGPIQIRTTKGRGHKSYKGYICLFVCMATRAIHLEIVSDLTAEGFLQAFKRFQARRGHCSHLWSDNGTNFIGAAAELKRCNLAQQRSIMSEVAEALAIKGCEWHVIPPHSPNFGGLWEAGVKSVKYHLKRIVSNTTLTYEEMATVLAQVEACLNSRPMSTITDESDNYTILTPGHFLIGEPLVTSPDYNFEELNVSTLRRWQHAQRMLQTFWRQWSQQYLTKFLHRYKWATQTAQPNIGDVVVVKEDNLPPCRWLYGRVIALHPGSDKIARVVSLKTKTGTLKRPVSKLCFLPVTKD